MSSSFAEAAGRFKRPEKITAFLLLFLLLTLAAGSVTGVLIGPDWGSLWKGLLLGLLLAWSLAIFRQPVFRSVVIVLVIGIAYILLFPGGLSHKLAPLWLAFVRLGVALYVSPGELTLHLKPLLDAAQELGASLLVVLQRVSDWALALQRGDPVFDPVAAGIVWNLLVLLLAAWAGWLVESGRNVLLAVLPVILLSLGTLSYVRGASSTLYLMLGLALLLLATVQHDRREEEWQAAAVAFPARKGRQVGSLALVLTAGLVLITVFVSSLDIRRIEHWLALQSRSTGGREGNLATSLGIVQEHSREVDSFETLRRPGLPRQRLIGAGPELTRQPIMTVEVKDLSLILPATRPWPLYWRSFTYDLYTGAGWRSSDTEESVLEANQPIGRDKLPNHVEVQAVFRPIAAGDGSVYAPGEPVLLDRQGSVAWRSGTDLFGVQTVAGGQLIVRSQAASVTEQTLRSAGQRYPDWVRERYLALPPDLPLRVKDLAIQLTGSEPTPYDRVRSIERYLRTFPYTLDVPHPPASRDLVDYFLFDLKEGYCDYYASAMVVLARAAGIPARLAIGYASGDYNEKSQRFMVTGADAHSWAEVYFPNTGWVPFEPTASRLLLEAEPGQPVTSPQSPASQPSPDASAMRRAPAAWILFLLTFLAAALLVFTWMAYDRFRLDRLPAQAATVEVYRRLKWYGARFAVLPAAGDTPYEYATAMSSRLEGLASLGRGARLGEDTVDQVRAIAETIVWISYRPVLAESSLAMPLQRSWYRLRWRLRWMLLVNFWKAFAAHFPFSRTHHNSGKEEE